jgi:hypothetical protein
MPVHRRARCIATPRSRAATFKFERTDDRVTAIEARGKLPPDFFQRFAFRGRVPNAATTLTWKVIQTYRNGVVVRYTGEPGEESASTTTVLPPTP